jgi:hypothetical protein
MLDAYDKAAEAPIGLILGINPSTADGVEHDHTTRKLEGFATRWGWGGYWLMNPFAYRSTDQRALVETCDPVGPDNGLWLLAGTERATQLVAAWGSAKTAKVRRLLDRRLMDIRHMFYDRDVMCLGKSKDGSPRHPLMLSYTTQLEPWKR